jgi:hypothetical protein
MGWWYWLDVKEILLDHETLNGSRIGFISDNRDVAGLHTFEQSRNKTLWPVGAAAIPTMLLP